ncbi:hypothetical protein SGRA_3485 [Saprospira grandis str. Lewin]|uniref:Uncharacterized protein n=1 Tax=Saprospira grandis (strain Lewin) TaxID=984262 RepID=H6L045_SAPGL|nr:hypothetical protein SGRA_3485 [Saprospira grandis str. Lewin]
MTKKELNIVISITEKTLDTAPYSQKEEFPLVDLPSKYS